jgi:16S rRNA (cytidine1402-2'-O)-methyltransferase
VPGASIVVTALVVSGLPIDRFIYLGFLPSKANERRRFLREIASESATLIMLEAPHRIATTLVDIKNVLGERRLAVCREMTKLHEEVFRGKVSQAIDHFQAPRGEFALVVEGQPLKMEIDFMVKARQELLKLQQSGLLARDAVPRVAAQTGLSHKELYRVWLALKAA